jgi:hypothetical protein
VMVYLAQSRAERQDHPVRVAHRPKRRIQKERVGSRK